MKIDSDQLFLLFVYGTLMPGDADDVPGDSRLRPRGHRPGGVLPEIDYQPDAVIFKQTRR